MTGVMDIENRMSQIAKTVVLLLLRGYKWALSPLFLPACRYVPSCSEYAMEAVERYGVVKGGLLAVWRVLRCHPLAKGGLDPVVETKMVESKSCSVLAQRGRETELCRH
jgi:putative membrane protein insertion efficiency factor